MKRGFHNQLREKCAVVGVSTESDGNEAAVVAHQALFALQHRGVEASGIVTMDSAMHMHDVRRPGMVRDVFDDAAIAGLTGAIAVGHNRYSTSGSKHDHLQPVISKDIGFSFAHNGNLPDTGSLDDYLTKRRYMTSELNDSEMFGKAIASKLHGGRTIEQAVREGMELATGAYSCTGHYADTLFAFRDPHGIRPLEIGTYDGGVAVVSETCALDTIGARHEGSVEPGELVLMQGGKIVERVQIAEPTPHLDMFELVYFARPDSYLRGQRVGEVRREFGRQLARMHPPIGDNPLVVPVPDTSIPAAEGYAGELGLRMEMAIVKNRYVGRTFMAQDQASRRSDLRRKHTMISERFVGRDVIITDDSIARGNTAPRLIDQAYEAGAKSVMLLSASPPIRHPDYYGVDMADQDELLLANMTVEQARRKIGADYLGFLSVSAMVEATNMPADTFNLAVFTGEYPISIGKHAATVRGPVSREYLD